MARIAGVDLPKDKRIEIGLTYVYGIGRTSAKKILEMTGVNPDTRVKDLSDEDEAKLLSCINGAPLFLLDKTMRSKDGTLVHYSRSLLRGDRASFVFSIQDGRILEG